MRLFVSCLPGLEDVLREELVTLGYSPEEAVVGGFELEKCGPSDVMRLNLELFTATRVLIRLGTFPKGADVGREVVRLEPKRLVRSKVQIAVKAWGPGRIGAEAKASAALGTEDPPGRTATLALRCDGERWIASLDTTGAPLQDRGYHVGSNVKAPTKPVVAAAMLRAAAGASLSESAATLDPFCGSGTVPIEAALKASGATPGWRRAFAFETTLAGFDQDECASLRRPPAGGSSDVVAYGSDRDPGAVQSALENARAAGVDAIVRFDTLAFTDGLRRGPPGARLVSNLPWHGRTGGRDLRDLYDALGARLQNSRPGADVALLVGRSPTAKISPAGLVPRLGCLLTPRLRIALGGIPAYVYCGRVPPPLLLRAV